jgi:hypothetical protein
MVLQSVFDFEPRREPSGILLVEGMSMHGVGCFCPFCFDGRRMMTCGHDLDDGYEKGNDDMILVSTYSTITAGLRITTPSTSRAPFHRSPFDHGRTVPQM